MLQIDKEYAAALFELAVEEDKVEEYSRGLSQIKGLIYENPEYLEFLGSPAVSLEERLAAVDEAFGSYCEYIASFLKLLCENGRICMLNECIEEFMQLCMLRSNKTQAIVYSAVELNDRQKAGVLGKLGKITGKTVEPVYIIDESLIGGVKIEVEGKTFDGSIRHRLFEVKEGIVK